MFILSDIINFAMDYRTKAKARRKERQERNNPGELVSLPRHNLSETQVYQTGSNFNVAIERATFEKFATLRSNSETLMASIGTCFAEEFSSFMKESKGELGKYLYVEHNVFNSSANWGRVYTIQNLLQIVQYSLTEEMPVYIEETGKGFQDPLREYSVGFHSSKQDCFNEIISHRKASKEVFTKTDILVITLGQNEAWTDRETNIIWGATPELELRQRFSDRFQPTESNYSQNLIDLESILDMLFQANENLKVILTVSPVAAGATFLDSDVITQSFAGKCIIRSVVHEVKKKRINQVYYFPSFEMVLCNNPVSFLPDHRHVVRTKVHEIFTILGKILSKN